MIDLFTRHLPSQVSIDIRRQYESLLPIFNSYIDSENERYFELKNDRDLDHFILALALFYSSVIIPLREAGNCLKDLRSHHQKIQSIRLSKFEFSSDSANVIHEMSVEMSALLSQYRISEHLLLFSDIKNFARNLNQYLKSPDYE